MAALSPLRGGRGDPPQTLTLAAVDGLPPSAAPAARDPLISALFARLPPPGSEWPSAERARWRRAAEALLRLVYTIDDDREIRITVDPTSRKLMEQAR